MGGVSFDRILLSSQFLYTANEHFDDAVEALIAADQASTGGANKAEICAEMETERGISRCATHLAPQRRPVATADAPKDRPAGVREGEHRRVAWLRLANVHPSRWCRGVSPTGGLSRPR